ncbi:hypothetical protein JCM14076_18380 [Methylosoma difficile]
MHYFRYLILFLLALYNPCSATETIKSTVSSAEITTGKCDDTPIPDPVTKFESLPAHVKLAEQVTGYNQPSRATCQSKQFKYTAIREKDSVQVISFYRKNGRTHASYLASKNDKITGNYQKHGILTAFWPDGKKQAVEYFCDGFAVGFHKYFNKNGKLAYVIDYSHSDYEWQKRIGVGEYRKFYQGKANWANAELKQPTHLFREVFSVENGEAKRQSFAIAGIFYPSWIALDNASSIEQWTKPGDQGMVKIRNQSWNVVNNNFDYLPFSEVYQRKKQALPGTRAIQSFHSDMLSCPWIDQAMQLGLEDELFKLKPVAAVSEQEIASSPQSRYAACLAKPNADCLFEHTYENLQFESSQKSTFVNGFGRAALATGYPEWTRKAMTAALTETRGFSPPNPFLAEPASLKAQAEFALGLNQEVEASLNTAFENAFTANKGYSMPAYAPAIAATVPLFLLTTKPLLTEKIRDFYALAESKEVPKSLAIVEAFAISLARQGKIEEALKLADEFFPKENPFISLAIDSAKEYKNIHENFRYNYLQALLALVDGRIKRGDFSAAQVALNEIENLEPNYAQTAEVAIKVASAYAQIGNVEKAMAATKNMHIINYYQDFAYIAISLCKAGEKTDGNIFADKIRTATFDVHSWEKGGAPIATKLTTIPNVEANLAKIELFCGDTEKAKASFKDILKRSDEPVKCRSDFCGDPYENAQRIRKTALDAGMVDLVWEQKVYDDPVFSLEVALQRAKNGDAASALSRFDSLATDQNFQQYRLMYPLIKAQILALLGRDADLDKAFSKARQFAIHLEHAEVRAKALLEIAKTYAELKKNEQAIDLTNEALANLAAIRMSDNNILNIHRLYPDFVRMLAELGADGQAQAVTFSLLKPSYLDDFSRRMEQELGRSRILGEVALNLFQEDQEDNHLADLKAVQPFGLRLHLWLKALKIADKQHNEDGLEFVGDALIAELNDLSASLDVGMGYQEKHEILHLLASILRKGIVRLTPEKQLETLQQLIEQARLMSETKEGAKALCELAYTAKKINQPASANTLFEEGTALAAKLQPRTFPIDERALGACAFWLKTAGDTHRANNFILDVLAKMPNNLETVGVGSIQTLLNVAIAYAEYENGEVNWLDGSRLEP